MKVRLHAADHRRVTGHVHPARHAEDHPLLDHRRLPSSPGAAAGVSGRPSPTPLHDMGRETTMGDVPTTRPVKLKERCYYHQNPYHHHREVVVRGYQFNLYSLLDASFPFSSRSSKVFVFVKIYHGGRNKGYMLNTLQKHLGKKEKINAMFKFAPSNHMMPTMV
jgi:hypothetical protein